MTYQPIHRAAQDGDVDALRRALGEGALPNEFAQTTNAYLQKKIARNAYLQKVIAAGGFRIYERTHLATLTATVKSKLGLPAQPARLVVEYAFHVGDY